MRLLSSFTKLSTMSSSEFCTKPTKLWPPLKLHYRTVWNLISVWLPFIKYDISLTSMFSPDLYRILTKFQDISFLCRWHYSSYLHPQASHTSYTKPRQFMSNLRGVHEFKHNKHLSVIPTLSLASDKKGY